MKPNELMIGDWVFSSFSESPCKITYLKLHESGYGSVETTNVIGIKDIASLSPIPITPEILEKNGWMYIAEDNVFYPENLKGELPWIYYITDGNNEVFRMKDFCNLQYVHQLQHALRLCEIEKNIEL